MLLLITNDLVRVANSEIVKIYTEGLKGTENQRDSRKEIQRNKMGDERNITRIELHL